MELGNLLFGNSRGAYPVDRDTCQDVFQAFLERNGFDGYGYKEDNDKAVFENDMFLIRPYYWGDSYCSIELTPEKFEEILHACEESLK